LPRKKVKRRMTRKAWDRSQPKLPWHEGHESSQPLPSEARLIGPFKPVSPEATFGADRSGRRKKTMSELPTSERPPEPEVGPVYTIVETERFRSPRQNYEGLRVSFSKGKKKDVVAQTVIWIRNVYGPRSKIGAFVAKLGTKHKAWVGKKVQLIAWTEANREIEVV